MDISSYISGYIDGEGCFCVTFNKSLRHKFKWDIRPSFSVSQNRENAKVLKKLVEYFDCGTIRPDRSDKTLKYEVRSINDLVERVIPHFRKYPILSEKRRYFDKFEKVCDLIYHKRHLTISGFKEIARISSEINFGGKKKYQRLAIKI